MVINNNIHFFKYVICKIQIALKLVSFKNIYRGYFQFLDTIQPSALQLEVANNRMPDRIITEGNK